MDENASGSGIVRSNELPKLECVWDSSSWIISLSDGCSLLGCVISCDAVAVLCCVVWLSKCINDGSSSSSDVSM